MGYKDILLHGSTNKDLDVLEPRRQTDFSGRGVTAGFASGDGIWPMFFAIVDRSNVRGSLRNGCFVVTNLRGRTKRFYFFSINQEMLRRPSWTDGMIYVLPRAPFKQTSTGVVRFAEWASEEPVRPLAKLPIGPKDFPFLNNVTGHAEEESIYASWVRFKQRQHRP